MPEIDDDDYDDDDDDDDDDDGGDDGDDDDDDDDTISPTMRRSEKRSRQCLPTERGNEMKVMEARQCIYSEEQLERNMF